MLATWSRRAGRAGRAVLVIAVLGALAGCEPNRFVTGWLPYWGGSGARAGFEDDQSTLLFSEVSPFWFEARGPTGTVAIVGTEGGSGGLNAAVSAARGRGLPVIPSITDGTGKGVMAGILDDPAKRAVHVQNIVNMVTSRGLDGIDLDYEVFAFTDGSATWAATRPDWVQFVHELGDALHAKGKVLSVTIPPTWMSGSTRLGYWVYDQEAIAPFVDRVRLMVYDWNPSTPSATAPMTWVNDVIAYSSSRVPGSKLQLGVPAYGRHWRTQLISSEICPDGSLKTNAITTEQGPALAAAQGRTPTRDVSGELTFGWTEVVTGPRTTPLTPPTWVPPVTDIDTIDAPGTNGPVPATRIGVPPPIVTCTVQHTVFYPDAQSIAQRAQAALAAHWSGISMWALGFEDAAVYSALGAIAPQRPTGPPAGALDTPVVTGMSVRLTGWALDPQFDLPLPVRITVAGQTSTITANVSSPSVATSYPGAGPFHGFDITMILPSGTHQACVFVRTFSATEVALPCQQVVIA